MCQAGLSTFQSGPKGTKMVNLSVFDHLGPFWAHLDTCGPFQTNIYLSNLMQLNPTLSISGKTIILSEMVQKGPDWPKRGPKWSKALRLTILVPFGPL